MTHEEFQQLMQMVFHRCIDIQEVKGKDYAGTGDALRVFKSQGERLHITPLQAWGVLADKGWNANMTFAATGKPGSEPLIQRACDTINYAVFMLALACEALGVEPNAMVSGITYTAPANDTVPDEGTARHHEEWGKGSGPPFSLRPDPHVHDFRGEFQRCTYPGCGATPEEIR